MARGRTAWWPCFGFHFVSARYDAKKTPASQYEVDDDDDDRKENYSPQWEASSPGYD